MRDTPILDFIMAFMYAVSFYTLGIVKRYELYWICFGAALVCCAFTLPPFVRTVRCWHKDKRSKGNRSNRSYKITIRSVHGSEICDGCGKKTENIGKCIAISGKERYEVYLCKKCFLKGVTETLKDEGEGEV